MPDLEGRAPPPIDLGPYQWQWAGTITFGEDTWCIVDGEAGGIFEVDARIADAPIPGGHGATMLPYYAAATTIVLPLRVLAEPHSAQLHAQLETIQAAFPFDTPRAEKALRWRMSGRQWVRYARCSRRKVEASPYTARLGAIPVTIALTATDPRYYLDRIETMSLGAYSPGPQGGWDLGAELPLDNAAPVEPPGDQYATNEGNAIAWPLIRIYIAAGELTAATIEIENPLAEYAATMALDFGTTAPPAAPDTVWVDIDAYVRATGTAPIRIEHADGTSTNAFAAWQHPRQPPGLPPGESAVRFIPVGTSEVTARLDYRSTWL